MIAIIAILQEKTRQTACLSNTKQLGLAFIQYTQGWAEHIYPYVRSTGVFKCPDGTAEPA